MPSLADKFDAVLQNMFLFCIRPKAKKMLTDRIDIRNLVSRSAKTLKESMRCLK